VLALLYLALSALLRLVLWARFGTASDVSILALPEVILLGAVNDTVEAVYLLAPLSLYLLLMPQRWMQWRVHGWLLGAGALLMIYGMLYLLAVEYFFFEEFDARFNLVAVNYLMYGHEVLINIRDSYPVTEVLVGNAFVSLVLLRLVWPHLREARPVATVPAASRGLMLAGHAGLAALMAWTFSTNTLAFSENRVTNELSANGVSSLFRALKTSKLDYMLYYRTGAPDRLFNRLVAELSKGGGRFNHLAEGRLDRHYAADPNGLGKLNVVIVLEESFGAEFIGAYGDTRGLTPNFDALAGHGLLFSNAYATGTRTVRGLEAIVASFPPIPSESIVKRPGSEHIANWGEVMRKHGYHTSFLYGGYGYFDNMNHFFASNGFDTSDRNDIKDPDFANIWGVSDVSLFKHAVDYFDRQAETGQPFFSVVLSTSNHKPYTFPPGVPGIPEQGGGRAAGVKYADYAIGEFFRLAETRPWFEDTLFVVVADHGARVYGKAQIPLKSYEIPLLLYSPAHIRPSVDQTLASQLDIAPTVLGMLGLEYEAPFFGQDVLHTRGPRTLLFNHNYQIAVYSGNELAILDLQQDADSYLYDKSADRFTHLQPNEENIDLAVAYYQTAFQMFRQHRYQ